MNYFNKEVDEKRFLKMGISGMPGSNMLSIAIAIGKAIAGSPDKIGVFNTEGERVGMGVNVFNYSGPFTVDKFVKATLEAHKEGMEFLIFNVLTSMWEGPGGLMADKANKDINDPKLSYSHYQQAIALYCQFVKVMNETPIHIISLVHSNFEYTINNMTGLPNVIPTSPNHRKGIEFNYGLFWLMDQNGKATPVSDRHGLYKDIDIPFEVNEKMCNRIIKWVNPPIVGKAPAKKEEKIVESKPAGDAPQELKQEKPAEGGAGDADNKEGEPIFNALAAEMERIGEVQYNGAFNSMRIDKPVEEFTPEEIESFMGKLKKVKTPKKKG